jgi:hypothetical protein
LLGLGIFCDQSAVAMRVGARLAGAKLILLPLDQHHKSGCSFLLAPYDIARLRCRAALALRTKAEQTVNMAKKRTKSDKAERQAEGLEKKFERRPAQVPKKKAA